MDYTVPMSTIGPLNYLVNTTSHDASVEQQWVVSHNYTLPDTFGVWNVTRDGLQAVSQGPMKVGTDVKLNLNLQPGTYIYGVDKPSSYTYDPNGESNGVTGSQSGEMMALWGVMLVT
jgi:hypothetical protein